VNHAAAQPLAEADPAGWTIGWGAWHAGMRDNEAESACLRRAAELEAAGPKEQGRNSSLERCG